MSGDVQPRKRKDNKKRKRDDRKSEGDLTFSRQSSIQENDESSHGVHLTKMGSDDVHLHVHQEHGTGGHWCAKIFFFTLLAILVGLVSLIILENRGLSDLDTPVAESRFSNYFDGWVEDKVEAHDDHDDVQASIEEHDEHDEPFEEEEAVSEGDDEEATAEEDEEEDEGENDEEGTREEEEEDEEGVDSNAADEDDNDENDEDDDDTATNEVLDQTVENDDDDEEGDNDEGDDDEDQNATTEASENATIEENDDEDDADGGEDDNDDENEDDDEVEAATREKRSAEPLSAENISLDNADENDDDDYDGDEDDNDNERLPVTKEQSKSAADPFDEDDDDDDGTFELFDNVVDNDAEELLILQQKAQAAQQGINEPPTSEENAETEAAQGEPSWFRSLAVKLGVGVALALVARLVLIRKDPNTNDDVPTAAMMKRRLTIASVEDKFPEDENAPLLPTDEFSEEEEIVEEEIIEYIEEELEADEDVEIDEDEEDREGIDVDEDGVEIERSGKYVPETFEQLNAMYRVHDYKEPSPHPTAQHPPHIAHKSETPQTTTPRDNNLTVNYKPHQQPTTTSKLSQKPPPVFIAPPPPSPTVKQSTILENPTTSTSKAATVDSSSHDLDYKTQVDGIYYDDDIGADRNYDSEELVDEEEEDEDVDEEEDISDISDIDDTDLMNRLEAKYGKLPQQSASTAKEYESEEDSDDPSWTQINPKETVNESAEQVSSEQAVKVKRATEYLERGNFAAAFHAFSKLSKEYPDQLETFFGECLSLYELNKRDKYKRYTSKAFDACKRYLAFGEDIQNPEEFRLIISKSHDLGTELGFLYQVENIVYEAIDRYPEALHYRKLMLLTAIHRQSYEFALNNIRHYLQFYPNDGFLLSHKGLVIKMMYNNYNQAVELMQRGIDTNAEDTHTPFLYLQLGEAYQRLNKSNDARKVYERAVALKLIPSVAQRALYYEPKLRAQPFWNPHETSYQNYFAVISFLWRQIRDEGIKVMQMEDYYEHEMENLRHFGTWKMFELYAQGKRNDRNCEQAPVTCSLIDAFPAARNCRRCQVKFSVMYPNTHVWPHVGPTNTRLRSHLGLVVPEGTAIRVGEEKRTWMEGEFTIFDDSFEHEVWQYSKSYRLLLIIDVWHPDLSEEDRTFLPPI